MRRREFITLFGGAAVTWPLAARAQQPRRIGMLMGNADSDSDQQAMVSAFVQGLTDLGWRDGRNIRIEYRWAAADATRLRAYAAELAGLALDVIFAQGSPPATALRQAAPATPIVFANVTDPVASGLVSSLAHPGGNLTGFTNFELTMGGKWLETLKQLAPGVARVAVILNPENTGVVAQLRSIEAAAPTLGVQASTAPVRGAAEIERAMDAFASGANGGLVVLPDPVTITHRELIVTLAARHRLPAIYPFRVFVIVGGLIAYGPDQADPFRQAAGYVDRILKGERPADLPVQAPTKYATAINVKTAKALGLTVPLSLLSIADEFIE